jgi:hypothetical protein
LNISLRKERADVRLIARRFRHRASQVLPSFGHNKTGRAIGRWYYPGFRIHSSTIRTEVPDAGCEIWSIPRSNCLGPVARGLMLTVRDACYLSLELFVKENAP